LFPVCHYWAKCINLGVSDYCCHDYWGQAHLNWSMCLIMADRKQGAGWNSGSFEAG